MILASTAQELLLSTASNVAAAAIIGVVVLLFRGAIAKWLRYTFPGLESKRPHVNFQTESRREQGTWKTLVSISNAGDEPAYNVYAFMAERSINGEFVVRSLGAQGIRRPVLGIRDALQFETSNMIWAGCGVTTVQELWIDFENSSGVPFRSIAVPGSPRGDEERSEPTRVIRLRLEQIPELERRGDYATWKKLRNGKTTLLPRESWWFRFRFRLALWINYGSSEVVIKEPGPGPWRQWLARRVEPKSKDYEEVRDVGLAG